MENIAPQSWFANYLAPLGIAQGQQADACQQPQQNRLKRNHSGASQTQRSAFNDITNNAHARNAGDADKVRLPWVNPGGYSGSGGLCNLPGCKE